MTPRRRPADFLSGPDSEAGGRRRPGATLQRGVIILPSAFTLGNLFFGIYAIIAAIRGDFESAGWFIVFAAILDMLDGRVARFTRTGSRFGAELDSLVDAISFGVAPAMIMYQIFFADAESWSWALSYAFIVAIVVRLARFNVEQGGEARRHFLGLPSPVAGMTLATWYPFSLTAGFQDHLADLPWPQIMAVAMVLIGVLMVSHVPYAKLPGLEFRSWRGRLTTAWIALLVVLAITVPHYYFFPATVLYIGWGLLKTVLLGLLDRLPDRDPLLDDPDDDEEGDAYPLSGDIRALDYSHLTPEPPRSHRPPPETDR